MKAKAVITVNYKFQVKNKKKAKVLRLRMRTIRKTNDDDENFLRCLTFNMQYNPKDPRLKSVCMY